MNKKLFKGALVLCASILMAVSCQSNSNPEDGKGGSTEKPDNRPTLDISLVTSGNNNGTSQEKAISYQFQNATSGQAPAQAPKITFTGGDSSAIKTTGSEGIVASVVSVKGLKTDELTKAPSAQNSKLGSGKKDLSSVLTKATDVVLAETKPAANNILDLSLEEKTTKSAVGTAIGGNTGVGGAVVRIKFEDKSGKKKPVELDVCVVFDAAA